MSWNERLQHRPGAIWAVSAGSLAAVVLLRWLLDPVFGANAPLVTVFAAVAVAVWAGGWLPAAAVAAAGYLACFYLFVAPHGGGSIASGENLIRLLAFFFVCSIIVALGVALRSVHREREVERQDFQRSLAGPAFQRLAAARVLAAIVESSDDAIVSKSLDGVIQSWNAGAERLFGYTAEQAVGRNISLIIPKDRLGEEDQIIARLRAGQRLDHFDTVRLRSDGTSVNVSLTVSPIRDDRGVVVGASKIARDVTERIQTEEKLRDEARRKTEFLAILAHELRGPLAPLRNAVAILSQRGGERDPLAREALGTMDRQLDQMVRLVDDLIDVSRITRDKVELRRQPVELERIVYNAVEAARPLIESANQQLEVVLPAKPVYLNADPARLTQVFGNLLHNANKFTRRGGRISISAESVGPEAVVRVKDDGIGIPGEDLARVFDMFTQVAPSADRAEGGLGIGLTLVKRLVEMHGGTVSAHSDGHGRGAEFVVRLPVSAGLPTAAASSDRTQAGPSTLNCLVVDDNVDAANSLAMLLELGGHQVRIAHDGPAALHAAQEYRPRLMLLDIGLPQMSGYEVCRQIRAQDWGHEMVIAALTGWGQEEDRRKSKEAGFDQHLVKPVTYDVLMELLASV
jgi:two-component system CheB/CheR fusion protein